MFELRHEPPQAAQPKTWPGAPGAGLAAALEAAEVRGLDDRSLRQALVATEQMTAWSQALGAKVVAEMARRATTDDESARSGFTTFTSDPLRFVADEVAVELAVSKAAGSGRVSFALELEGHPSTFQALQNGQIDRGKAEEICSHLGKLETTELAQTLETAGIAYAQTHTRTQLRAWLAKRVIAVEPLLAEKRRERARQQRCVRLFPGDDGMATLLADLPAENAVAIYRTINQIAHASCADEASLKRLGAAFPEGMVEQAVPHVTNDGRTMDQRRADALTDLVLGAALGNSQPSPTLASVAAASASVIVDAETLAGVRSDPGELVGYGAITAEHARELIDGDARWRRLLTDDTGQLLEVSHQRYRPGRQLSHFVVERDVTCRFPGCRRPAAANGIDLDHTVPFPTGETVAANLAALCRSHHILKTHGEWNVAQDVTGVLTWTTPSGRVFRTYPHDYRSGAPSGTTHPT